MSSGDVMMPSPYRNPAVSSKSAPGVRIVTATACFVCPARSLISIGSSVASASGRTRILPSSTIFIRAFVLLVRLGLPEVFSSIGLSWFDLLEVYQRQRVSMHGRCTMRSGNQIETNGPPERLPLPRGDRRQGRDDHPHPLRRSLRGAEDERPARVCRRGRGDGGAAAARAATADRLQRQAWGGGSLSPVAAVFLMTECPKFFGFDA